MDLFSTKIAYAAGAPQCVSSNSVDQFVCNLNLQIINPLITLLFALAVVFFLYGVFEFMLNQANEEKKTDGKSHMIWGIIGMTIMLGAWAIMSLLLQTLKVNYIKPNADTVGGTVTPLPKIPN